MTGRYHSLRRRAPLNSEERKWEQLPDVFGRVEDISDTLITREQGQFLLTDATGDIPRANKRGLGLYSHDTRHLSSFEFLLDGAPPLMLLSTADSGFTQEQVLGNYRSVQEEGRVIGRCTIEITRQRVLNRGLEESLQITNYNTFPVSIRPSYFFDADFADIFEVRGHQRKQAGNLSPAEVTERSICYRYWGADGVWRRTLIAFDQPPDEIDATRAVYELSLGPRETKDIHFRILLDEPEESEPGSALRRLHGEYSKWHAGFARIRTDNEVFNEVVSRSISDLRVLWTNLNGLPYIAAGTPWYATLFGRDSIITALQTLPFSPEIARDTLVLLAKSQGQTIDAFRCEEPGKILHEMREDELSVIGELPYERYYGSADSTPLFLLLAAEYFHWTADRDLIEILMPAISAGLRWLHTHGDPDGDGFLEYATDALGGLRNQGWKDSIEGVMHSDGSLCEGPISLVEVQGYVYAAYLRLAPLFEALGDEAKAGELRRSAATLRRRFNRAFWLPDLKRLAMALDGKKRPSEVMSSNAGQALWSGILRPDRAPFVRDALFQNDMFSGWGIRTLSSDAISYYPLGYHVGTVWPHDNGIIALGLKRYGFDNEVNEIATALFDAAREFPSYRLPELFGGQPRSEYQPPVPYPVACRPQAWTAGAQLHLLQAMLGLYPDAANKRLYVIRPRLPYWLKSVHIGGLQVGTEKVDLRFYLQRGRTSVAVETSGDVNVVLASSWRRFLEH
ncbi:MAG: amylo-alpha-1,6-glucosidase [Dehalococcoidia bacterium]|nr:amylo-alpha-1,6-glucosidase [Dehalococcoidia bacterium]